MLCHLVDVSEFYGREQVFIYKQSYPLLCRHTMVLGNILGVTVYDLSVLAKRAVFSETMTICAVSFPERYSPWLWTQRTLPPGLILFQIIVLHSRLILDAVSMCVC